MCGTASALYFCACLFLCCFPSPEPYFNRSEPPKPTPVANPHKVVVQPVVVDNVRGGGDGAWDYDEENDDGGDDGDYEEEQSYEEEEAPSKKVSKKKKGDDKISDDDFDFEVPTGGTSRIEYVK